MKATLTHAVLASSPTAGGTLWQSLESAWTCGADAEQRAEELRELAYEVAEARSAGPPRSDRPGGAPDHGRGSVDVRTAYAVVPLASPLTIGISWPS